MAYATSATNPWTDACNAGTNQLATNASRFNTTWMPVTTSASYAQFSITIVCNVLVISYVPNAKMIVSSSRPGNAIFVPNFFLVASVVQITLLA